MQIDNSEPEILENYSNLESLLKVNGQLIADLKTRVMARRFKTQAGDPAKLSYARALIQSLGLQATIIRDFEVEAVKKEIQELREMVEKAQSLNHDSVDGRQK